MESNPLITKYRPDSFELVIGNEAIVASLKAAVQSDSRPHAYLFTGIPGLGKTTLARIIAKEVGASLIELDAAAHNGVDDTKQLVSLLSYRPLDGKPAFILIDECHALTAQSWKVLLKPTEEPPPYFYFAFSTTEAEKVPPAIKTRCFTASLKPLKPREIEDYLQIICDLEGWKVIDDVFASIVLAATGQPRKALTLMQAGHGAQTREELATIIAGVEIETNPVFEICKLLVSGNRNWKRIAALLEKVEDDEEIMPQTIAFFIKSLTAYEEKQAIEVWRILESFMIPRATFSRKAQFGTAVCHVLFGNQVF